MSWLERYEALIRLVFRGSVISLLALCWWELHEIERQTHPVSLRTVEQELDRIQRDVEKIKESSESTAYFVRRPR